MSVARRVAAVVVGAITAGVVFLAIPAALVALTRARFGHWNPLAGITPPWEWDASVSTVLAEPLPDDVVVDLLVRVCLCAAWVAIAVVLWSTIAETAHFVRHRDLPRTRRRGTGWARSVGRLVAMGVIALLPATQRVAAGTASLAEVVSGARTTPIVLDLHAAEQTADATPVYGGASPDSERRIPPTYHEVRRGESVWSIAAGLADGSDARTFDLAEAILDENLGEVMVDGDRFTTPALIRPGWMLRLPPGVVVGTPFAPSPGEGAPGVGGEGAVGGPSNDVMEEVPGHAAGAQHVVHRVEEGDTLSAIAHEHLGDADAWPTVFEANEGRLMPDGRTVDDPHVIVPGWDLVVPVATVAAETVPVSDAAVDDPGVMADGAGDAADSGTAVLDAAPGTSPSPDASADAVALDDADPTREPDPVGDVTGTPVAVPPVDRIEANATAPASPTTAVPSTAAPATTAVPASGTTVPAVAHDERDAGADVRPAERPIAPTPLGPEHAALVAAGVLALVGVRRARRMRSALPGARIPAVPDDVAATERGLRAIDEGEGLARLDVALRALGRRVEGRDALVGLVRAAPDGHLAVRITAAVDVGAPWIGHGRDWELPAHVPLELLASDSRMSGPPCHALVEIGRAEGGERLLVDLEAAGLLAIEARPDQAASIVRSLAAGLAASPYADTSSLVAPPCLGAALLDHPNAQESVDPVDDLRTAIASQAEALAPDGTTFDRRVRRTGSETWAPTVVLLPPGDEWSLDSLGDDLPLPGRGVAVVACAGDTEQPAAKHVRLTGHDDRWELIAFGQCCVVEPIGLEVDDVEEVSALLADADRPLVADRAMSEHAAPTSIAGHDPIRDSHDEPPHEVVVGLLGDVEIRSRSGESGCFERSKTVELIAWLATHRDRATRDAARTALWEIDVRDSTFANVVSEARRALARLVAPPEGDEWVGRTLDASLPLHDLVVTDADLVRDRLDRARSAPPREAIALLEPAVEMVRGLPFSGTGYLWPDADGITSDLILLATTVTAELAAHALAIGDVERVFRATGRGLRVLPGHEELIALRMRAHARSGDLAGVRAEWESYERVVDADAWSDGEPAPKLVDLRRELLSAAG